MKKLAAIFALAMMTMTAQASSWGWDGEEINPSVSGWSWDQGEGVEAVEVEDNIDWSWK